MSQETIEHIQAARRALEAGFYHLADLHLQEALAGLVAPVRAEFPDHRAEYGAYFDRAQVANVQPLSYGEWVAVRAKEAL